MFEKRISVAKNINFKDNDLEPFCECERIVAKRKARSAFTRDSNGYFKGRTVL